MLKGHPSCFVYLLLFSFIFLSSVHVWMYHMFNRSPFEEHLGSIQFGAVRNKAAMNLNGSFYFSGINA